MKLLFGIMITTIFVSLTLMADDMKVLSVKGKVTISGSKGPGTVRAGMRLIPSDKITLSDKATISLLHSNGRALDVKSSGAYKVSELMAKVNTKTSGVTKKFASYVYNELTDTDDSPLSDSHKKKMGTTGSVERATGDRQSNVDALDELLQAGGVHTGGLALNSSIAGSAESMLSDDVINIILPRSCYLLDPSVTLRWNKLSAAKEYCVEIVDAGDNVLFKKTTADTSLAINFRDQKLNAGTNYYWSVSRDDKRSVRSSQYCLQLCTESQAAAIRDTIAMINTELGSDSPFASIIQAQFAEDQGLHILAVDSYKSAIQNSTSEDYKRYFRNYLRRLNLYQNAPQNR